MFHLIRVFVRSFRSGAAALATLVTLLGPATAHAQCAGWTSGPLFPDMMGAYGASYAATTWDPDGAGPLGPVLVVGGEGGVYTWDGLAWRYLEGGALGISARALTVYNGALIAGGQIWFTNWENPHGVAWWTGSGWAPLGGDIGANPSDHVNALAVYNGELYAAGVFGVAGGVAASNIARWNGSSWNPVGIGFVEEINTMILHNNQLYVGGDALPNSGGASRWNGSTWTDLPGVVSNIRSLCVYNGSLYAAVDDPGCVLRHNGSAWVAVGHGLGANSNWPPFPRGHALTVWNGLLIAGGSFQQSNGVQMTNIAAWNGTIWSPMAGGISYFSGDSTLALAIYGGALYAVGDFPYNGNDLVRGVVRWTGTSWTGMGAPTHVYSLAKMGSQAVLAGYFGAPSSPWYNIATWDGRYIQPLGAGTNAPVRALAPSVYFTGPGLENYELFVAGDFTKAGGIDAQHVAVWKQPAFTLPHWEALGSGLNSTVFALARIGGRTVAGGAFTASGSTPVSRIARWSDAPGEPYAWRSMGSGFNGSVYALKTYNINVFTEQIVAAGEFTFSGATAANRIASWNESSTVPGSFAWAPMGSGFNASVYAVERHGNSTYAAGAFTASGATAVNRIARWTGTQWAPVGNGIGFNGPVYSLKSINGYLYAGGSFTSVDGVGAWNLARWNGTEWTEVYGGANSPVLAFEGFHGEVLVGGQQSKMQLNTIFAQGLARFLAPSPWLLEQPASITKTCGEDAYLWVEVVEGYDNLQYQWRKAGVPLVNGVTASGSTISGATTDTLQISDVSSSDAGAYDCVITGNTCTDVTSSVATLTVTGCCPADIDGSGSVTVTDLLAVINGWGGCANPSDCPADIAPAPAGDDQVNVSDLLAVINAWGPCP